MYRCLIVKFLHKFDDCKSLMTFDTINNIKTDGEEN